jgi:hypothetical protein
MCIGATSPALRRRQSVAGGGRSLGSLTDSANCASSQQGEAPGDHAYKDKSAGWPRRCRGE